MASFLIEPLGAKHDRAAFDCGEESLNTYLKRYARQNASRFIGITYVAVPQDEPQDEPQGEPQAEAQEKSLRIAGYYSLSTSRIEREYLPATLPLPRYPVPSLLLARLAVDKNFQGQKLAAVLLLNIFERTSRFAAEVGLYALEVVALNDAARTFYEHFQFVALADDPSHLYLPVETMRRLYWGTVDAP